MCPERSTLSAYYDGELEGDAFDFVDDHVRQCASCSGIVEGYRTLSDTISGEVSWATAAARSRDHILTRSALGPESTLWRRSFRIPAPLAAAAALIIVVLSVGLVLSNLRSDSGLTSRGVVASGSSRESTGGIFEDVVRYLDSKQRDQPVVFNLPKNAELRVVSEPTFVRAADYRPAVE